MPISEPPVTEVGESEFVHDQAEVYRRLSKLPPFQPAALKLLSISTEGYSAIADFEAAFRSDLALTADLLMVANSAQFGARSCIDTIKHALTFLGMDRVRSLASTVALGLTLRSTPFTKGVRLIWSHSIATAVIAEQLGTISSVPGMYTAALTHDLGRLGMLITVGQEYEAFLAETFEDMEEANRVEKARFGMRHCEAGAFVAETWGFPIALQAGMAAHHDDMPMSPPRKLVQIACELADSLGYPEVQWRNLTAKDAEWEQAKLTPELIRNLVEKRMTLCGGPSQSGPSS